jgi:methyl-accepting chemotaxis protein
MQSLAIQKILSRLWFWFIGIMLLVPFFSFLLKILTEGQEQFKAILRAAFFSPVIFFISVIYFYYSVNKLRDCLELISGKNIPTDKLKEITKYVNSFPLKITLLIALVNFFIPSFIEFINLIEDHVFSWEQALFFWISDIAIAIIAASLFFYQAKQEIYPVIDFTDYKPIKLYHKILIPTMSLILSSMLLISVGVYQIGVVRHEDFMRQIMSLSVEEAALYLNTTLEKLLIQVDSYAKNEVVREMNLNRIKEYLKDLQEEKESFVKTFFVSDMSGETVNSLGFKFNVKAGKIFQSIQKNQKFAFSNPVKSKDDGSDVVVCAVPITLKKDLIGNFGMTFAIETIGEALAKASENGKYDFIMYSAEGTIIYNKNYKYLNNNFNKEFIDKHNEFTGFPELLNLKFDGVEKYNRGFQDITFEGVKMHAMVVPLPKFNSYLVMFIPKKVFYQKLNITLLEISAFIIIVTISMTLIIRSITNKLTIPILNTINIFEKISSGDLTTQPTDFVPDEFGEIIRNLKKLIIILQEIVSLIQMSSKDLENTSVTLSDTTIKMAESSQHQATSLNESVEFLNEISRSVEMVAENSKSAYFSSKTTYNSMEDLLLKVKEVRGFTQEARTLAISSNKEAEHGNELMKNAISGMENIDQSSKKISEIVGLIGDISKQTNLLALNAAIEAARAGEYGRGFSVVAEEIGKLADKTSLRAKNIKEYIEQGLSEIAKGKVYVNNTALALANIIAGIHKNSKLMENISEYTRIQAEFSEKVLIDVKKVMNMAESISQSTEEQASSNQELANSVSMIKELTNSLASGSEDIARTSLKLSDQSKTLNQQIEFFKI